MAYELIETVTLDTAAASIEFTSIPQDGTDLVLKVSARSTSINFEFTSVVVRFNVYDSNDYTGITLNSDGSNAVSQNVSGNALIVNGATATLATANTFGNSELYISNYTSTNPKSLSADGSAENNGTTAGLGITALEYSASEAITSFIIGFNLAEHSTASLYKVTAA